MIRRVLKGSLALIALGSLAGCGMLDYFGKRSAEPDTLAKWAATNGVSVGTPAETTIFGDKVKVAATSDGKGYEISSPDKKPEKLLVYYVPLDKIDPALDKSLREKVFPGGIATVASNPGGSGERKKVAESELDKFYVQFMIVGNYALCDDYTRPCDAAAAFVLVGKLKGQPLLGDKPKSLLLAPQASLDISKFIEGKVPDSQTLCGFDSKKDRLPAHISGGCEGLRRLTFAADNDFTVDPSNRSLMMMPLTSEALKKMLSAYINGTLYEDGVLKGAVMGEG